MQKEFLKNFQVNGAPLPDAVIDAIMAESARDLEAAKADAGVNGGTGGKTFTQEDVNRIVSERLARDRADRAAAPSPADDRERDLKAREARLDCREYLASQGHPVELLDILDTSDVDKFKASADRLRELFGAQPQSRKDLPQIVMPSSSSGGGLADRLAEAFKSPGL